MQLPAGHEFVEPVCIIEAYRAERSHELNPEAGSPKHFRWIDFLGRPLNIARIEETRQRHLGAHVDPKLGGHRKERVAEPVDVGDRP